MPLEMMKKTRDRLSKTPEGSALLKLIEENESIKETASVIGFSPELVRVWILRGKISKHGAIAIERLTGIEREEFRPDLAPGKMDGKPEGRPTGHVYVATTEDAKLLVRLAEQHGSVKDLCAKAFCTVSDYHTWKSRGRIPAIKLPTFLGLQQ